MVVADSLFHRLDGAKLRCRLADSHLRGDFVVGCFCLLRVGARFIKLHGKDSVLARALGKDKKNIISVVLYAVAIGAAFISTWLADALYVLVAIIWLVPDRRIEQHVS